MRSMNPSPSQVKCPSHLNNRSNPRRQWCHRAISAVSSGVHLQMRSLKKYSGPTFDGITGYVQVTGKTPSPLFETPVVEELYSFANGKFYSGDAFLDGRDNFAKVKAALYQAYGQPSFVNEKLGIWKWKWQGTKIEVHLSYQTKFSRTWVTFQNYAI